MMLRTLSEDELMNAKERAARLNQVQQAIREGRCFYPMSLGSRKVLSYDQATGQARVRITGAFSREAAVTASLDSFRIEPAKSPSAPPHNTFRAADAFEYVDAYRTGINCTVHELHSLMAALASRLDKNPPTHLLATYRGYEHALLFLEKGHVVRRRRSWIVKLDDRF